MMIIRTCSEHLNIGIMVACASCQNDLSNLEHALWMRKKAENDQVIALQAKRLETAIQCMSFAKMHAEFEEHIYPRRATSDEICEMAFILADKLLLMASSRQIL